ncbi:MAG: SGNH/GDSL hydrolase family protein [Microcoleaceae cyanobacterium]
MSKVKIWAVNTGLVLGSLSFGVLISEIGLRLGGVEGLPQQSKTAHALFSPSFFTISHPDRGWANLPGAKGWWEQEGRSYVEINQDGWRDRPYAKTKPENTIRVAVLGDSFTLASQVSMAQNYTSVIETRLKSCSNVQGKTVEVLNFGVDGYGTAQELITLRQEVWNYNPDVIVLAFFIGNDVIDNSKILESNHYRPFFTDQNGTLVLDHSFRELTSEQSDRYWIATVDKLPSGLVNHSRLLQVIRKVELENRKRHLLDHLNQLNAQNFQEPEDAAWKEAWQITEALITEMNTEAQQNRARFLLVTIGDPIQVHPKSEIRNSFMKDYEINNLFYSNERLKQVGEQENFPVLDLAKPFQSYSEQTQSCLHGFPNAVPCGGHWNPQGHEFAGELITQKLCEIVEKF